MPTGNSLYQRKPGRLGEEKKKFRTLVEKLEKRFRTRIHEKANRVRAWTFTYYCLPVVDRLHVKAFAAIRRADAGFVSEEAGLLIF
jgi:predicted SprT family Zn-dependent metalloprotease